MCGPWKHHLAEYHAAWHEASALCTLLMLQLARHPRHSSWRIGWGGRAPATCLPNGLVASCSLSPMINLGEAYVQLKDSSLYSCLPNPVMSFFEAIRLWKKQGSESRCEDPCVTKWVCDTSQVDPTERAADSEHGRPPHHRKMLTAQECAFPQWLHSTCHGWLKLS